MIPKPPPRTIPFTPEAFAKIKQDFDNFTAERVIVMQRLQVAREMGDLSENGAYHYAKFELGSIGRRLRELRHLLDNGFVVKKPASGSTIVEFGCTVTVSQAKRTLTYTLVSQFESDPQAGKLSQESPLGKALLGKRIGDTVHVETPRGLTAYTITNVL